MPSSPSGPRRALRVDAAPDRASPGWRSDLRPTSAGFDWKCPSRDSDRAPALSAAAGPVFLEAGQSWARTTPLVLREGAYTTHLSKVKGNRIGGRLMACRVRPGAMEVYGSHNTTMAHELTPKPENLP